MEVADRKTTGADVPDHRPDVDCGTFAWLGRNRRLSKDYEYAVQTSETMIDIAAIRLMLNRLTAA